MNKRIELNNYIEWNNYNYSIKTFCIILKKLSVNFF